MGAATSGGYTSWFSSGVVDVVLVLGSQTFAVVEFPRDSSTIDASVLTFTSAEEVSVLLEIQDVITG
eukprot:Skav222279  [mRNA]  locus=scaffold807:135099:135800:- [translate_table: standard]